MQKKEVAVVDVGSSNVTAVIAERGINKTFVIKARFSYDYDGFNDGEFFDIERFRNILYTIALKIKKISKVETVYVGVPGDFTKVFVREGQVSFAKKKKVTEEDVNALFESAYNLSSDRFTLINRSAIVYELDDMRRMANPVGALASALKGKLSFIVCDNYFMDAVNRAFNGAGVKKVECVSTALAEALYLIDAENRDRTAILVDVGYISTNLAIVQGDGIVYQKPFGYGGGYITAALTEKFEVSFDVAETVKKKVSLSRFSPNSAIDLIGDDDEHFYSAEEAKSAVIASLDTLCDNLSKAIISSGYRLPDYIPFTFTGGGISYIRGAKEYVANKLKRAVEMAAPKVPLMDKPTDSSLLSIMELALEQ